LLRRLLVWLGRLALTGLVCLIAAAAVVAYVFHQYGKDLPDYQQLADYAPPMATRVYAGDGRLLAEYARQNRVFVPIEAIPDRVKDAFIAAEDKSFYDNMGIDPVGIVRATIENIWRLGSDRRPLGASTITQQVAKNFLLSDELSLSRKIKEAILAIRMNNAFTKDYILELYLNQIFLGNRSYGVAAAALNYFNKSLDELTISEAAFLGGLPQAPSRYDPTRNMSAAVARRDYVLRRMEEDGYITHAQAAQARHQPLTLRGRAPTEMASADFFTEEVRRQLVGRFGEKGFYEGGLAVRATVSPRLQSIADGALRDGLSDYDRRHTFWRGPVAHLDLDKTPDWRASLDGVDPGFELFNWRLAVVTATDDQGARIGFDDGSEGRIPFAELKWARRADANGDPGPAVRSASQVVSRGDVVLAEKIAGPEDQRLYTLRQRPLVEGAIVALDPHTGRVLAMSGGFSFRQSKFNRATQARRQPGSAFKPFVYMAALENGYTPSSIVLDAPIAIDQGPGLPLWRPENYTQRYYGPTTLRVGLEDSRNLMTVRLAQQLGMGPVLDVAKRFGIDRGLGMNLADALGSNEVTPLELTTAYAMIVNGGKQIAPYLVERIQDRHGKAVMRADNRPCPGCQVARYDGGLPPDLPDDRAQVEDPRIAYQMVNMLEGVIQRGTGVAAKVLDRPLAGKTGTTNDSRDAWFVGFSPDLVCGVYVGYDQPQSLGKHEQGASVALPIWIDFMRGAIGNDPPVPFRTPPGVQLVQVDAQTGLPPGPDSKSVISEAFLPGTVPSRSTASDGSAVPAGPAGPGASAPSTGGIY
jgi:penicillin-binding protein 1A